MKLLIAGSRSIKDFGVVRDAVFNYIDSIFPETVSEIVVGGAQGVDELGERLGRDMKLKVSVFHADWEQWGKKAGIFRNREMGQYADAAVVVWDGSSPGSKHMIEYMQKLNKPVAVVEHKPTPVVAAQEEIKRTGNLWDFMS